MARKRLGKGLDFLISGIDVEQGEDVRPVKKTEIRPNPLQPRTAEDHEADRSLEDSIRRNGVLQPILLRKVADGYELIAGERRWRACMKIDDIETVPAVVKSVSDRKMLELALVENVQRKDLNPIEQAVAYRDMMKKLQITQEDVAQRVGKSRAHIANFVRLLNLPEEIQDNVSRGTITMGHAKSILSLKSDAEKLALFKSILEGDMTVRQAEQKARRASPAKKRGQTPYLVELEETLMQALGTKVRIKPGKKGGKIVIEYYSNEDFERIVEQMT